MLQLWSLIFKFFSKDRAGAACKMRVLQFETEIHLNLSGSSKSSLGGQDGVYFQGNWSMFTSLWHDVHVVQVNKSF